MTLSSEEYREYQRLITLAHDGRWRHVATLDDAPSEVSELDGDSLLSSLRPFGLRLVGSKLLRLPSIEQEPNEELPLNVCPSGHYLSSGNLVKSAEDAYGCDYNRCRLCHNTNSLARYYQRTYGVSE